MTELELRGPLEFERRLEQALMAVYSTKQQRALAATDISQVNPWWQTPNVP